MNTLIVDPALEVDPQSLANRALRMFASGQFVDAVMLYQQALSLVPTQPQWHFLLAFAAWKAGDRELAGRHFTQTARLAPDHYAAHQALADWCRINGDLHGALLHSHRAAALAPHDPYVMTCRAWALADAGQSEQVWPIIEKLDAANFHSAQVAALAGRLASVPDQQNFALKLIQSALELPDISPEDRQLAHLAATEVLDHIGRYDDAFSHAVKAHQASRRPYYRHVMRQLVDRTIEYFTPEKLHTLPRASHGSRRPVFIVGMPRSGTTLVEQILATHPDVHGAGELSLIHDAARLIASNAQPPVFPDCLDSLPLRGCNELAGQILSALENLNPTTRYVTDKMPQNFMFLGLIAILFPDAHIIHCTRDPLDTCLSCYTTHFTLGHEFAQDLSDLGDYFRQYQRLMSHWRDRLKFPMIEMSYERVVSNFEGEVRRLLEHLDLGWDERCLNFHRNTRHVPTASVQQVRRPLYSSSVGRWRRYEKHLQPLIDGLRW